MASQIIVVCTEDAVLSKKVRFLLARDECDVEILASPTKLERRLNEVGISLLILSRTLDDEDALDLLARLGKTRKIPTTLVLGGQSTLTADFITIIPDPIDTQAIYRIASEALAAQERANDDVGVETLLDAAGIVDDPHMERTVMDMSLPRSDVVGRGDTKVVAQPQQAPEARPSRQPPPSKQPPPKKSDLNVTESEDPMASLDSQLMISEEEATVEGLHEEMPALPELEDLTMAEANRGSTAAPAVNHLGLAGVLEPVRFAKVLFQCWTMEAQGALVIAAEDETLTVYFEDGFPVHLESNIPGEMLGRALANKGKLTDAQYGEAAKLAIERGLNLGQSLVELGFLTREALGRELGEDAHERIVRKFAARSGAFEFDPNRPVPRADRPYRIPVGRILVDGLRRHCDDETLAKMVGNIEPRYFRLRVPLDDIARRFPLLDKEREFLAFSGRAYNIADASDTAALSRREARVLMALLITCEEVEDFTPGVGEFEARIREERERAARTASELEAIKAQTSDINVKTVALTGPPAAVVAAPPVAPLPSARPAFGETSRPVAPPKSVSPPPVPKAAPPPPLPLQTPPPPAVTVPGPVQPASAAEAAEAAYQAVRQQPQVQAMAHEDATTVQPQNGGPPANASIPPMPTPPNGTSGRIPRPVVFSPPLPRGADGSPQETPERTRSRQHFQRGVTLLGQGNFDDAEAAFRDAIALCSEEHVYLIGLARAIYYNPSYTGPGKVPVLREIVSRASHLAPDDGRVTTLVDWVKHAEAQV